MPNILFGKRMTLLGIVGKHGGKFVGISEREGLFEFKSSSSQHMRDVIKKTIIMGELKEEIYNAIWDQEEIIFKAIDK